MSSPAADTPLPEIHVIAFVGPRRLPQPVAVRQAIGSVFTDLRREAPGEWMGISGVGAKGEEMFAETAREFGWARHVLLPVAKEELAVEIPPADWPRVTAFIDQAERSEIAGVTGSREESDAAVGAELVHRCDVLLVVWDGQPGDPAGDVAATVEQARAVGRTVFVVDPTTGAVRREGGTDLGRPDACLEMLNALPATRTTVDADPRARLEAFLDKVDTAATRSAPHFRRLTTWMLGLQVVATALTTYTIVFVEYNGILPWGKISALLAALVVAMVMHHQRTQVRWIHCRVAAELTRAALAMWGLPRGTQLLAEYDWRELEPLRRTLDILHRRAVRGAHPDFAEFKRTYLADRVDGQMAYYARQENKALPQLIWLRRGFTWCTLAAIGLTSAYAIGDSFGWSPPWLTSRIFFDFTPVMLPVAAAACLSLISVNDLQRRVVRYREIRRELEKSRREIELCRSWSSLGSAVDRVEHRLLQEVHEWRSLVSFSETH